MRVDEETEVVVLDAEGRETSYRATLMPERRHKAANVAALASLGEAARVLGGKVVRKRRRNVPEVLLTHDLD